MAQHLTESRGRSLILFPMCAFFLEAKLLAWLEVLSVLGDVGSASVALEKLMEWLQEFVSVFLCCIVWSLTRDEPVCKGQPAGGHRPRLFLFATKFFEPINHFRDPHLSLCTGVGAPFHRSSESCTMTDATASLAYQEWWWNPEFMGPDHILFRQEALQVLRWSPCGRFICCADDNGRRDPKSRNL